MQRIPPEFSLLGHLEDQLASLSDQQLRRQLREVQTPTAPSLVVDGESLTAFCSNDYLGLASDARVIEALREGALRYGAGSGASHLISGHSTAHAALEARLAEMQASHLINPRALFFSTGYMANLAVLTALAGKDADIFSEALNHASLIDGARLSRARVTIYTRDDLAALDRLLAGSTATTKLVVTDSVFSMEGAIAPLPELLALCERHQAWLVVDDAHGFGVLGEQGAGVLQHFALRSRQLVYVGTLGKAAGVAGAFVAAHGTVIEWLVQRARTYIYTTATPPAIAHALLTSLDIISGSDGKARRQTLQAHIEQLRRSLKLKHWRLLASDTPIQAIVIGANQPTVQAGESLRAQGLWVAAIRPPTVPKDTARLRVTLSAAHDSAQVTQLAAAINIMEGA
jgi:8-amino-7-oxononanoate synthase